MTRIFITISLTVEAAVPAARNFWIYSRHTPIRLRSGSLCHYSYPAIVRGRVIRQVRSTIPIFQCAE